MLQASRALRREIDGSARGWDGKSRQSTQQTCRTTGDVKGLWGDEASGFGAGSALTNLPSTRLKRGATARRRGVVVGRCDPRGVDNRMAGPEPQRSIGMHPHQTSDGAPVDTEEDMMDLDSPLKVRTGALDGMDVDASEPPSYDAVGATRKQPAPVGGGESAACGATERRNVAAESSACPTRIIHSKPLATAGAVSVSTTRTLPRQPTARTGTSVAGAGGNSSSTVMPGTAGRTNASFAASTVSSSAAAEQASTSRTDHHTSTAKVTAETARPGIGGYETAAIDTRRHANDENREKTVAHFHGS